MSTYQRVRQVIVEMESHVREDIDVGLDLVDKWATRLRQATCVDPHHPISPNDIGDPPCPTCGADYDFF